MGRFDIERARQDTPGLRQHVFLDSAGSSLPPMSVLQAVIDHLEFEGRVGGYRALEERAEAIEAVYDSASRLIGADRDEIALLENATRAWDAAFYALRFGRGDRILTDTVAYGSNYLAFLQVAHRTGAEIVVSPDNAAGQLELEALEALIDRRTKLIAAHLGPDRKWTCQSSRRSRRHRARPQRPLPARRMPGRRIAPRGRSQAWV